MFITAPFPVRFFFAAAMLLAAGCASTLNDPMQRIPVTSSPSHAAIALACAGDEPRHAGYTPATIALRRDADGCEITLSKLGYREETVRFRRVGSEATALDAAPSLLLGAATGLVEAIAWAISGNDFVEQALGPPFAKDEHRAAAPEQLPARVDVELLPRP